MEGPKPRLPQWAIWAGCPLPKQGETFRQYVTTLGLDPEELLEGLEPRTAVNANLRLASALMDAYPSGLPAYIAARRRGFGSSAPPEARTQSATSTECTGAAPRAGRQ